MPTRAEAFGLLTEHTENPNLIKHMLAVEAAMRAYARKFGEDEELWAVTGLIHDFDYEKHPTPEEHPAVGIAILRELDYPESVIHAIQGHAPYLGVPRVSLLDRALFAVDELSGFIVAVALTRPSKSLHDVEVASVRKKMKQSGFARAVSREDIELGARELGIELDEHIGFVIEAMREIAGDLGLEGRKEN